MTALSVVASAHNEEGNLAELHARLVAALDATDLEWELILVDNGSTDRSFETMLSLREADPRVKVLRLSRNFGLQLALTAGLDLAEGDAAVVMASDLQDPPEVVPELVRRWREGYDVVYGLKIERRDDPWLRRWTSPRYHRLLNRVTGIPMPIAAADFWLADRRALDAFLSLRERTRYLRGMFSWIGFRQSGVPYSAPPRRSGRSKFNLPGLLRLGADGIFSLSVAPLRLILKIGFAVSALAALAAIFAVFVKLSGLLAPPGWTFIVVLVSLLSGFQLIVLGVMGEYIGLIYDEVKRRPMYLVRERHGFEAKEEK